MSVIFFLLFLTSIVSLGIGIKNPQSVLRWSKEPTKRRVVITYGAATLAFLFLTGVTAPKSPATPASPANTSGAPTNATLVSTKKVENTTSNASSGNTTTATTHTASVNQSAPNNQQSNAPAADPPVGTLVPVVVAKNVDGDTIDVTMPDGQVKTVRMLLIDTPETVDPKLPVEPYGPEASEFAKEELPPGKHIYLEEGVPGHNIDKYGRLLAFVYINKTDMYNEDVVRRGLARVAYIFEPNTQHLAALKSDQEYAQAHHLGIWSIPGYVTPEGFNISAAHGSSSSGNHAHGSSSPSTPSTQSTHSASSSHSTELKIISSSLDVAPGDYASITIQTAPGASASIEVDYKSGPSHAKGLEPKTADSSGYVTWEWKVGTHTTPGQWPVIITSNGHTIQTTVNVH
jgi:micrococcal nuclease